MTQQQGFTLIEVLVSLIIVTIMAVGATGYQMFASQKTTEAQYRTHAIWLAKNALDRLEVDSNMRVPNTEIALSTNDSNGNGINCAITTCTRAEGCTADEFKSYNEADLQCASLQTYNNESVNGLPGGTLNIACPAAGADSQTCTVTVAWVTPDMKLRTDKSQQSARLDVNQSDTNEVRLSTVIPL